jgi:uncharacterized membrane protein
MTSSQFRTLLACLALYAIGRICQIFPEHFPDLSIVLLNVVPPALFALVHGAIVYGRKGTLVFCGLCAGIGGLAECLSLQTGFPFGHYAFTGLMGPGPFHLPVLLVLAYLGIGYASWTVALLILNSAQRPLAGLRLVAAPVLASLTMLAWDLAMDPQWALIDQGWVWKDGGAYYGVPLSNFIGWLGTAVVYYSAFTLWCRKRALAPAAVPKHVWSAAVALYALCAFGNALTLRMPIAFPVVADATGKQWAAMDILKASALVSLLVMAPLALMAWLRLRGSSRSAQAEQRA